MNCPYLSGSTRLTVIWTVLLVYSLAGSVRAQVGVAPSTPERIQGRVIYEGRAPQKIVVEAHLRGDFADRPVSSATLKEPGDYELKIKSGIYYLRAFVDLNENGFFDSGEPEGEYDTSKPIMLPPLSSKTGIDIAIKD
jgi:hypothetical protein